MQAGSAKRLPRSPQPLTTGIRFALLRKTGVILASTAGMTSPNSNPGGGFMIEPRKDLAIGVFEQEAQAEKAVSELWRAGFAPDRIDMANRRIGVVPGTPRLQFQK